MLIIGVHTSMSLDLAHTAIRFNCKDSLKKRSLLVDHLKEIMS